MAMTEEDLEALRQHDLEVQRRFDALEREKADLADELAQWRAAFGESALRDAVARFNDLNDQLNVARREIGSLSRDLQVARRERGTVEAARDSAQERERHALAEREQAWANVEAAQKERLEAQQALAKAENELTVLRARLEASMGAEAYAAWQESREEITG